MKKINVNDFRIFFCIMNHMYFICHMMSHVFLATFEWDHRAANNVHLAINFLDAEAAHLGGAAAVGRLY